MNNLENEKIVTPQESKQDADNKKVKNSTSKIKPFISGAILFGLSFVFTLALCIIYFTIVATANSDNSDTLGLAIIFTVYGSILIIPIFALCIISMILNIISIKSDNKKIKIASIVMTIVDILFLIALITALIVINLPNS